MIESRLWVSVAAAVYDDETDSFLLIQRADNGLWQPPGGLVESGELLSEAVVRETEEETGGFVQVIRPTGIYESPKHNVISIVFACRFVHGTLRVSNETVAVKWVHSRGIGLLMDEAYSCRLIDSLSSKFRLRTTDEIRVIK